MTHEKNTLLESDERTCTTGDHQVLYPHVYFSMGNKRKLKFFPCRIDCSITDLLYLYISPIYYTFPSRVFQPHGGIS